MLSLDEAYLYVSDGGGRYRFPVNADGSLGTRSNFPANSGSSDGMGIDCQGNLYYTTNNTVQVVSPTGTIARIDYREWGSAGNQRGVRRRRSPDPVHHGAGRRYAEGPIPTDDATSRHAVLYSLWRTQQNLGRFDIRVAGREKVRPFVLTFEPSTRLAISAALFLLASGCYGTPRSDWPAGPGGGGSGPGIAGIGGAVVVRRCWQTDSKNCGNGVATTVSGAFRERSTCKPLKLADVPHEFVRTIGLAPDYVLVGGGRSGRRPHLHGEPAERCRSQRTRPSRVDGSYSSRLVGTRSTLVAADVYTPGTDPYYLSHCPIADCSTTSPAAGSNIFDGIRDFAFDTAKVRVFWFDPTSNELVSTNADAWSPVSAGPASTLGQAVCRGMAQGSGRVFGAFDGGIIAISEDGSPSPVLVSGAPLETAVVEIAVSPESLIILGHSGNLYTAPPTCRYRGKNPPDPIPSVNGVTAIATSGSTLLWSGISDDLPVRPAVVRAACPDSPGCVGGSRYHRRRQGGLLAEPTGCNGPDQLCDATGHCEPPGPSA